MTSRIPPGQLPVPDAVARLAVGTAVVAVWVNEIGGRTFELPEVGLFVKWLPAGTGDLAAEAERLDWARRYTPVPQVLELDGDGEGSWLVTVAIDAESAVAPRWKADPAAAVRAIGEGLRALHDALPVIDCPFSWSAEERVARVPERERHRVAQSPHTDLLVVCHGDACSPNTLIADDGRWAAHVDLGTLGVADRWADLAVATMATEWNYGSGWERALLDAYGVDLDRERTEYYRLLWNLSP